MNIRFVTFILFLALLSGCHDKRRLANILRDGDNLLKIGKTDAAVAAYTSVLAEDPCSPSALSALGKISYDQKRYLDAVKFYTQAIGCNPRILSNFTRRAYCNLEGNNDNDAKKDALLVLKRDSLNSDAYHILGLIATKRRNFGVAMSFYNRAIKLNPEIPRYYNSRAALNCKLKSWPDARRDFELSLAREKNNPKIYAEAAMVDVRLGKPSEGLRKIQAALHMSPSNSTFLDVRAFVLLSLNQLPKAFVDIEESMKISPYSPEAYRNLGIYYYMVGEASRSIKALKHSALLDANLENIHYFLGLAYFNGGLPGLACAEFKLSEKNNDKMVTQDLLRGCH